MSHGTVQLLDLGALRGDEAWFFKTSNVASISSPDPEARWKDLVLWAGLIHHPEQGLFLYETGGSRDPEREWAASGFSEISPYT